MNPWIWRIIIIILSVAFVPLIVSWTVSLVTSAIHSASEGVHSLFRPLSQHGDAKLEGVIRLCLYLIAITLLARFVFSKKEPK
jgi:hypothetical protein